MPHTPEGRERRSTGAETLPPRRLALIADTHIRAGRPLLPEECLRLLAASDLVIHAGDLVDLGALEQLRGIGPPVIAVSGNVDDEGLSGVLPEVAEVRLGDLTIAVIHDAGSSRGRLERMRRRFPDAAAVVFGHSHIPLLEAAPDGFQIFNPGSPTVRRRQPSRTMGLGTAEENVIRFELVAIE